MITVTPHRYLSPAKQLGIFLLITFGLLIAGAFLAMGLIWAVYGPAVINEVRELNITSPQGLQALWFLQIISTTLPIFSAPVIFAWWVVREPRAYLKPSFNFSLSLLAIVLLAMLMASPVMEVLININERMVLPHFLKGVEDWMRASEKTAERAQNMMLQMHTIGDLMIDLLLIGLLTAIAEELMFRGVIQTIFLRWTRSHHAAIWITAILFSAFHMEFYGFLPRLMLGVFFGYFVYWSGSIWTSVWAHFINNGTAVLVTYLYQHKHISMSPDDQHVFNYSGYIVSIIITVFLLYTYRNIARAGSTEHNY